MQAPQVAAQWLNDHDAMMTLSYVMGGLAAKTQGPLSRDLAVWAARLSLKAESLGEGQAVPGGHPRAAA